MTVTPQDQPRPPSLVGSVLPPVLFMLLCGVVGPIFLIMGLVMDPSEPGTGWLLPTGIGVTALDVVIGLLLGRGRYLNRQRSYRLSRQGRPARGKVLSFEQTNVRVNEQPLVNVRMRIEGRDVAAFDVESRLVIPEIRIPLLYGGDLPVLVDPETHEWEIDWAKAPVVAPSAVATGAPAAGASAADRLAELDSLLARDLISRDEYDTARARILGEI
ncbi:SHOCT domain-containing protein [Nocardioides sp. WV_118_6]